MLTKISQCSCALAALLATVIACEAQAQQAAYPYQTSPAARQRALDQARAAAQQRAINQQGAAARQRAVQPGAVYPQRAPYAQGAQAQQGYQPGAVYLPRGNTAQGPYYSQRPAYNYNGGQYNSGQPNEIVTMTPQGPVRSSKYIDPVTGEEISTTYWRDPATGQVTTSRRVVDPRTGKESARTRTQDPNTGTVQRSRTTNDWATGQSSAATSGRDPYTGQQYRSRSTYDPYYGESYQHRDPVSGGSTITVPYRSARPPYR
jgi:hypothetical protein